MAESFVTSFERFLHKLSFTGRVRAEVWDLLAKLTSARMDAAKALDTVAKVYADRREKSVQAILLDIRAAIPKNEVKETVALYSSSSESLLFSAYGETDVSQLFRGAVRIARAEQAIMRAVLGAVAVPSVVLLVIFFIVYVAGNQLFPTLLQIITIEEFPGYTQWFAKFTLWFAVNVQWIILGIIIFFIIVGVSVPRWTGFGRRVADRFPPYNLYKLRVATSFLFVVIEAGRAGRSINSQYLFSIAKTGDRYTRSRIEEIAKNLPSRSLGAATIAASQDFPAKDLNTILVAFSGQENWLENFAQFLDDWLVEVELAVKRSASVMNAVLMAIAAGTIGMLLGSVFVITQSLST